MPMPSGPLLLYFVPVGDESQIPLWSCFALFMIEAFNPREPFRKRTQSAGLAGAEMELEAPPLQCSALSKRLEKSQ